MTLLFVNRGEETTKDESNFLSENEREGRERDIENLERKLEKES